MKRRLGDERWGRFSSFSNFFFMNYALLSLPIESSAISEVATVMVCFICSSYDSYITFQALSSNQFIHMKL